MGTIAAGKYPASLAVDSSGKFAYVGNQLSNNISIYSIDGTSGALTSTGAVGAGLQPDSIVITARIH